MHLSSAKKLLVLQARLVLQFVSGGWYYNTIPLKRIAKPIELAKPITFLLSSDASFITGASLVVDGGKTADLNAGN